MWLMVCHCSASEDVVGSLSSHLTLTGIARARPILTAACEGFSTPSRQFQFQVWFGTAVQKCDKLWNYHKQVTIVLKSHYTPPRARSTSTV